MFQFDFVNWINMQALESVEAVWDLPTLCKMQMNFCSLMQVSVFHLEKKVVQHCTCCLWINEGFQGGWTCYVVGWCRWGSHRWWPLQSSLASGPRPPFSRGPESGCLVRTGGLRLRSSQPKQIAAGVQRSRVRVSRTRQGWCEHDLSLSPLSKLN